MKKKKLYKPQGSPQKWIEASNNKHKFQYNDFTDALNFLRHEEKLKLCNLKSFE